MAKQPKPNMTYQDLMKLDTSELERLAKHYRKLTWQRIDRLKRANLTSPATEVIKKLAKAGRIPAFGTENRKGIKRTKQSAVREILSYDHFMSLKTSTVKGARNFIQETASRLGASYDNASPETQAKFWKLYDKFRSEIENNELDSDRIQKELVDKYLKPGYKNITQKRVQELSDIVEEAWKRQDIVSSPFDAVTTNKSQPKSQPKNKKRKK